MNFSVGPELLQIGDHVLGLLVLGQAGEQHLGARDHRLRVLQILRERRLVPDEVRVLVGVGVAIALIGSGLAPDEPGDDRLSTGGKSFWIRTRSVMIRSAASDSQAAALPDPKAEF